MEIVTNVEKAIRVWSLDGGGRGVLSQLIVVDKLMRHIQWKQRLTEAPRPCDHADVMIGTGLGGAAAILMGILRLTASETYDEVVQIGRSAFMNPSTSSGQPLFSPNILRSTLGSILERHGYKLDIMMTEDDPSTKKCHVIVKDNATGHKLLSTYASPKRVNCTVVDAIVATMVISNWLDPTAIGDGHQRQTLIGASMGDNNLIWEGLLEAREIFGVDARVTSLISIGSVKADSTADDRRGCVELTNVDCQQTMLRLAGNFRDVPAYIRIAVDGSVNNADASNWEEELITIMNGQTTSYLEQEESQKNLDRAVVNLLQEAGIVNLGQITQAAVTTVARSIPRLTPYYVHRPEVTDFMEQSLTGDDLKSQKMLIIHGVAGSGKTQSASFFECKNRKIYKHVFFIDASSITNIKVDLQSAIRSLGGSHSQDTFEDALRYLKSTESGHWLVIFDNADDPNLPLVVFVPSCDHGHIIVTTRNAELTLRAPNSHLRMPKMDDLDALSVLFMAAQSPRPESQSNRKDALEICKLVGNLPFSLVQVGCYCYSSKVSFTRYLDQFKEHRQKLMELRSSWRLDEHPHSAYTSISLSYLLLSEAAKSLLHLLAFFHPSSIHVNIFRASAKHQFDVELDEQLVSRDGQHDRWLKDLENILLINGEWNQAQMDALLVRLQSISLISLTHDDGYTIVTIHPLIQSFVQGILTEEDFNRFSHMATRTLSGCIWDEHHSLFRHLIPHIFEMENRQVALHLNDTAAFAYLFSDMAFHREAAERWRKVKVGLDESLGSDHRSTLFAAKSMAHCLSEIGDYEAAVTEMMRVIVIQEKSIGRDHDDTLESYLGVAMVLPRLGKLKEAELILRTNLQILQSKYGKRHPDTLITTSWLGLNLYHQERFDEAETVFDEVIPMMIRIFGEDNISTSKAIVRLSRVLMRIGRWAEAENYLQNVLKWRVKRFGIENGHTVFLLQDLALCIQHRPDLKEAERLQRFVLEIWKKHCRSGHRYIAEAHNALEETLQLINRTNRNTDGVNANDTNVWNKNKVEFVILFALVAFTAAFSCNPIIVVFR